MRAKKTLIALLALGASFVAAPHTQAATAEPAWQLSLIPMPSNFAPGTEHGLYGPEYFLIATNVGAAPTSGEISLEVTLPDGVIPIDPAGGAATPGQSSPECDPSVGPTVTCTADNPVHPGRWLGVHALVDIAPDAEGTLIAEAKVSGGDAGEATATVSTEATAAEPSFDFLTGSSGIVTLFTNADGSPATQAGSHPEQLTVNLGFTTKKPEQILVPTEHIHGLRTDLPPGVIVNPAATPVLCTEAELVSRTSTDSGCPISSQVGLVNVMTVGGTPINVTSPLYNMVPPPGVPAQLGFDATNSGIFLHLQGEVRSDGDYGLAGTVEDILAFSTSPVFSSQAQLWGDPSGKSHDQIRGVNCLNFGGSCPVEEQDITFLSMPSQCTGPIMTKATIDSWEQPAVFKEISAESTDLGGTPVGVEGCNQLAFEPTISSKPTTNLADSPSGLDFNLHQPQNFHLEGLSTAALKDAVVTLPEGLSVNPSQADGLQACTSEQIGLKTEIGATPIDFSKDPDGCPDAAKIGKVEVRTPLLAEIDESTNKVQYDSEGNAIPRVLQGSVYVAKPFDNPFNSLLAIYFSIDDPKSGTVAKLAGKVEPDPVTGQLRTVFEENPQLPLEDVDLHLFTGPRASLRTPPTCDSNPTTEAQDPFTTVSDLTPWSSPEGPNATPTDSFAITASPSGGDCPVSAEKAPNKPSFSAGTISPQAGAYSPFVMKIAREDASQPIAGIEATLPPGLSGKLAGIAYCPETQIAQAKARSKPNEGAIEQADPSCPSSSEVGSVDVAAGAGITPLHVEGKAYLAGAYKGAPLSLVIITPAVAGPFDLGVVLVRTALYVNPKSAQIKAISDPLPTILEGIPLDVRQISLRMARPQFTLNPTSCDPMTIDATTTSIFNQAALLQSPFQVGGCSSLPFKPQISIRLKGKTKRGGHPALIAIARFTEGHANTKKAAVTLPRSAFLDQGHIRTVCTRVQFAADQCPEASVYGFAKATTPLLDNPLEGPVYLRSSDHELPDLVAALSGQVDVELVGRVDSIRGGIRNTFEATPDAPVSTFVLQMQGGRKGLLINSADLCEIKASRRRATVLLDGQNGKTHDFRPLVKNDCGKARKRNRKRR